MTNRILIKNALIGTTISDLLIEGNKIARIAPDICVECNKTIDATNMAVIPGLVNTHTHTPMTLLRGFADDMPLMQWLENAIWPNEANMSAEHYYWGAKLACLEMIKTGTTTFLDMYMGFEHIMQATEEMGIRGVIGSACFDHFSSEEAEKAKDAQRKHLHVAARFNDRLTYAIGPHAIYTVSGPTLQWCHEFAEANNTFVHLHVAETQQEVDDAIRAYGTTPVRYLQRLGILSPRLIMAHGIYVDDEEMQMLADSGVKVAHNPASNLKLASGYAFKFQEMESLGIPVGIGTDGCASSNNLDMIEAMKLASLIGKAWRNDPEALSADCVFKAATTAGNTFFGMNTGYIAEGRLADLCIVNLRTPAFTPNFNFTSNLVYAANGSCIDTTICDGRILMEHGHVEGEETILQEAARVAMQLTQSQGKQ